MRTGGDQVRPPSIVRENSTVFVLGTPKKKRPDHCASGSPCRRPASRPRHHPQILHPVRPQRTAVGAADVHSAGLYFADQRVDIRRPLPRRSAVHASRPRLSAAPPPKTAQTPSIPP